MIYNFFNELFINTNLIYNDIIKFIVVDLFTFLFSIFVLFILYKLFYSMIISIIKKGVK